MKCFSIKKIKTSLVKYLAGSVLTCKEDQQFFCLGLLLLLCFIKFPDPEFRLLFPTFSCRKQVHDVRRLPQIYGVQRLLRVQPDSQDSVPGHGPASHQLFHLLVSQHLPDRRSAGREEPPGCVC